jgi:hypothetical protein
MTEKTQHVFELCLEIDRLETERRELEASLTPEERADLDDALQIYSDTLAGRSAKPENSKLEVRAMSDSTANNPRKLTLACRLVDPE